MVDYHLIQGDMPVSYAAPEDAWDFNPVE